MHQLFSFNYFNASLRMVLIKLFFFPVYINDVYLLFLYYEIEYS